MKCPNCNCEVPNEASVCPFCAVVLPQPYQTRPQSTYVPPAYPTGTLRSGGIQIPGYAAYYVPGGDFAAQSAPRRRERREGSLSRDIIIILLTVHIVLDCLLIILLLQH